MSEIFGFEAYAPKEIAARVEATGVTKTRLPLVSQLTLGILAGGFIGLGALYYTLVASDASLGFAASRLLGGLAFSLGLILVVVAGAELFTGNNLMVMAWASRRITTIELLRSWIVIYLANFVGALVLVLFVLWSQQ
jgi:formate/nitrite transporter FocA (FNT family)